MNAFLLAAGKGTRLLPLTLETPKCLVPIQKKPLLSYWLDLFQKHGIQTIYMNSSYLKEKVDDYLASITTELEIKVFYEEELLGSLGTLVYNKVFLQQEREILVCYADNLTNMDLSRFLAFHHSHSYPATIGLFETPYPKECGILDLDANGVVTSFVEKPAHPTSHLANAGVYVFDTHLFQDLELKEGILDIAFDLLPHLIGKMKGYPIQEFIYDIGNLDKLQFAEEYVSKHPEQFC